MARAHGYRDGADCILDSVVAQRPVPADSGDEAIRATQDKLLGVERSMTVTGDPAAPMFGAMADFVGVLHQHGRDTAAVLDGCRQAIAAMKQQVISDEQVRQITFRMISSHDERVKQLVWKANLRSAAIGLAALLVAGLIGGGIVRYLTPSPPELICGRLMLDTGQPICYRTDGPVPPVPPAPPQTEAAPSKPKGKN